MEKRKDKNAETGQENEIRKEKHEDSSSSFLCWKTCSKRETWNREKKGKEAKIHPSIEPLIL